MSKQYYVYIMTNDKNGVLYTGVTSDLARRVFEHKNKIRDGFSSRYNLSKLVYYEVAEDAYAAIAREKHIKAGSRQKKEQLIQRRNSTWMDLSRLFTET